MTTIAFAGGGTGGHLFPALAIARAVTAERPDWQVAFAGSTRGVEATVLPEREVPHRLFPFEPIHRTRWWRNARWPFLAARLVREVDAWLDEVQPSAVIGTGGYVSGPVLWRAARRGLPTAIAELDVRPGIATRLLAPRVDEIWLAVAEARAGLPRRAQGRAVVTGAPIAPPERDRRPAAIAALGLDPSQPVIVVTGGSQGSLALNRAVAEWLAHGGGSARQVVWATGRATHAQFAALHAPPAVQVIPFIDPMADAWAVCDLAVARAGMMTLSELAAWGIPAILVPLPTAAADHQTHNALAAEASGAARCLRQADLSGARLGVEVDAVLADPATRDAMAAAALRRGRPDAAAEIAGRVVAMTENGEQRTENGGSVP